MIMNDVDIFAREQQARYKKKQQITPKSLF